MFNGLRILGENSVNKNSRSPQECYEKDRIYYPLSASHARRERTEVRCAGIETALNYYEQYKKTLPKDKGAEQLLKMKNKGTLKDFIAKELQ